jgi:hypothetical protein
MKPTATWVVALGATALFVLPLEAQMVQSPVLPNVSPRPPFVAFEALQKLDGLTFCVGSKVSFWLDGSIDGGELKATIAHERKHVEQYHRFATCADFDLYYRTPVGRLESETEAYVAGWCAAYGDMEGLNDPLSLKARSIHLIATGYGFDPFMVVQTWKKYEDQECPGHPEETNLAP